MSYFPEVENPHIGFCRDGVLVIFRQAEPFMFWTLAAQASKKKVRSDSDIEVL